MDRKISKKGGFTLIEMLIVIVIIGILAAFVLTRLSGVQGRARDTARKTNLEEVAGAIIIAQMENRNQIPSTNDWTCIDSISGTLVPNYISSLSQDPAGLQTKSGCDYYSYFVANGHVAVIAKLEGLGGNATSEILTKTSINDIQNSMSEGACSGTGADTDCYFVELR